MAESSKEPATTSDDDAFSWLGKYLPTKVLDTVRNERRPIVDYVKKCAEVSATDSEIAILMCTNIQEIRQRFGALIEFVRASTQMKAKAIVASLVINSTGQIPSKDEFVAAQKLLDKFDEMKPSQSASKKQQKPEVLISK